MTSKLFLVVCTLCTAGSWSQRFPSCVIDDPSIDWTALTITPPVIQDVGSMNLVIPYTGSVNVSTPDRTDSGANYIDASIDPDAQTILIRTNNYFIYHFEAEVGPVISTATTIVRTIHVSCNGEALPLILTLYVLNTNNQAPRFLATRYYFRIPMPIPPKVDLRVFGDAIVAEDLDFSVGTITFSIEPEDKFVLESQWINDTKTWRAILRVTEFTRYDTSQLLTIKANDGVNEQQAIVNITKDDSLSLPDCRVFLN